MIRLEALPLGASPPDDINVVITAPKGAAPLAVRIDELTGTLTVVELYSSAMVTPGNVGIVPHTLTETADPLGAVVLTPHRLAPAMVVAARPVGVLHVASDHGEEVSVLAVPASRLTRRFDAVQNYSDLPAGELRQIAHFFSHCRDLEEGGRRRDAGWGDRNEARRAVLEAAERARRPVRLTD